MSIPPASTTTPRWLHLIWASADQRPWIPENRQMRLCHELQRACRRHGLYLELVNAQSDHVHLLLRLHRVEAEARLRGLMSLVCREFAGENLPVALRRDLQFLDWRQPLRAEELGMMRRHILRQDRFHRFWSLPQELIELDLDAPNGACIVLGEVVGEGKWRSKA